MGRGRGLVHVLLQPLPDLVVWARTASDSQQLIIKVDSRGCPEVQAACGSSRGETGVRASFLLEEKHCTGGGCFWNCGQGSQDEGWQVTGPSTSR